MPSRYRRADITISNWRHKHIILITEIQNGCKYCKLQDCKLPPLRAKCIFKLYVPNRSNYPGKWIIRPVFYFIQYLSFVRREAGDGRVNLAVLNSTISPKAKASEVKCSWCSSCPVNLTETSTVSQPVHNSFGRTHLLLSSHTILYICWLVYQPQLVLNWVLDEMWAASKYPFSLLLGISCLKCLCWKRLVWDTFLLFFVEHHREVGNLPFSQG